MKTRRMRSGAFCALARSFTQDRTGTAAVEFAMISPMLLVIVAGVLAYGVYFGAANSVQQLAADAARASVAGLSDDERAALAAKRVADSIGSYVLIDPKYAVVTAKPSATDPNVFRVSVSYDASRLGVWALNGLVPLPSRTIVRSAAIQRGGY